MQKAAHALLDDLDKETVDFRDNYDGTLSEPVVVPAKFPNLLVNGAGGIAVGMATNIPPHNLVEVINGCIALIDDPAIELPQLMEIIPGPDFPTGAIILGRSGIRSAYETGRGSVIMRGVATIEPMRGDREQIIITEDSLPGEQGDDDREDGRTGAATSASRASPTCATNPTVRATASSSN